MEKINFLVSIIAFLILGLGLIKANIKSSYVSEPLIALMAGVLLGPVVLGLEDIGEWNHPFEIMHQLSRLTLAMAVMASALRLPSRFVKRRAKSYLTLLFGGMVLMLVFSSLAFYLAGFSFWESLLAGAILAPTDPVLATTIVSSNFANHYIPAKLRNMLTAESASNDGLAYALVLLPLFVEGSRSLPFADWFTEVLLWENAGAILLGGGMGYLVGRAFRFFHKREFMVPETLMSVALSFTFLIATLFPLIKMNGIIGVFSAGIVFQTLIGEDIEERHQEVQSMMERLFVVPVFVILGFMLPLDGWKEMPASVWIVTPLIIFLRRIPALFILKPLLGIFNRKEIFFMGWFGPIGVAALFYITLLITRYPGHENLWPVITYAVVCSTLIHAVTANPFSRWFFYSRESSPEEKEEDEG